MCQIMLGGLSGPCKYPLKGFIEFDIEVTHLSQHTVNPPANQLVVLVVCGRALNMKRRERICTKKELFSGGTLALAIHTGAHTLTGI